MGHLTPRYASDHEGYTDGMTDPSDADQDEQRDAARQQAPDIPDPRDTDHPAGKQAERNQENESAS